MQTARSVTLEPVRAAPDPTRLLVGALTLVLLLLVVPPLWFLIQGSLHTTTIKGGLGEFTFDYYRRLLADRQFFGSLTNSLIFSIGATVIALCFGGLVAWLVERTNAPLKAFAYLTAIISLGTPFVLYVIAWLFLLGRAGPLNDLLTGLGLPRFNVYSMPGMILVEGFLWSPLSFLLLSSVFQSANSEFEEAARMSGAGILRTVTRISMRMALPAFAAVALLMMVRSIEAFEVPALVGLPGHVKVLTTDIYLDMRENVPPDLGYSSAFSIVLLVLAGGLLSLYSRMSRHASRFHSVTGRGFRSRPFDLGRLRYLGSAVIVFNFLLILALPALGLIWLALMPFTQSISRRGFGLVTFDNFRTVLNSTFYLDLVWKTLVMSAGAATCVMALTVLSGWLAARRRPGGWLVDQLATAPLIFPGIVLGVAMIQIYLAVPFAVYGTLWAFVIAFTIRYLPYGMRYATAGVMQIHPELEEAASVAGSPLRTILRRIVMPLTMPALLAGWLFIFLIAARDLSMAVILASPSAQPVSVAMFDLWANGQGTELAAFGLVWTAIMTLIAAAFYLLGRRTIAFAVRG